MAKGERTVNPATAALKSQKARALKKGKAAIAAQRQERLANQNPNRVERQIADLEAAKEARGGQLRDQDQKQLEKLKKDLKLISKAKGDTGDDRKKDERATGGGPGGRGGSSSLGKRNREDNPRSRGGGEHKRRRGEQQDSDSEATDPEVRNIPMPRDESPPVPLRRSRRQRGNAPDASNSGPHGLPAKPESAPSKTTYSSAPQMRNLQAEATSAFVPAAVAARKKKLQGEGGRYLEPEEVDKMENEAKEVAKRVADAAAKEEGFNEMAKKGNEMGSLADEERAFQEELKRAEQELSAKESMSRDVEKVAREAEKEEAFEIMAEGGTAKDGLREEALKDAKMMADAAEEEAKHRTMADVAASKKKSGGVLGAAYSDSSDEEEGVEEKAEKHLRHVEIEEVEDEGD